MKEIVISVQEQIQNSLNNTTSKWRSDIRKRYKTDISYLIAL